eukprot:CAMPEP_0172699148 /NCGR_PEP_ID=MMETSP1074-20121228/29978_1 /TAXON_ID=2916 /ORGANISM="Ceratium fusus, Strain PA161109" /LENGTH=67 /DNA_ID=CAMNT_0013520303 /DNA_START=109 /DNA_END=312 /DNA_ORIENTATION=-
MTTSGVVTEPTAKTGAPTAAAATTVLASSLPAGCLSVSVHIRTADPKVPMISKMKPLCGFTFTSLSA